MQFQYMLSGVTAGHGDMAVHAVNVPVSVAGMDVSPGEIIHMDENGACKFPAERIGDVCKHVDAFSDEEAEHSALLLSATDGTGIKNAWRKVISKGVGLDERSLR